MKCKRCFNFNLINFSGGAILEAQIYFSTREKKSIKSVLPRKPLPNLSYHNQINLENY